MSELQNYIDTQVAQISPFKKISLELAERANEIDVTNDETCKLAVLIRKEITKHQTAVKNARLDITRQFDDVKAQFITAEKDVLEPAEEAKNSIGNKILAYEAEQERLRLEEEQRIKSITDTFTTNVRAIRSMKAAVERMDELTLLFKSLPHIDQDNGLVKLAFTQTINALLERKDEIRTAEVDEMTQQKAKIDREADEALAHFKIAETEASTKQEQKEAPKTGIKTVTKFTVINPELVPRELCVPSDQLIREAIKQGIQSIPGVEITQEKSF